MKNNESQAANTVTPVENTPKHIHVVSGNILNSSMQTLMNTVNCGGSSGKGVMGKGIALAFKNKFPAMYEDYKLRCSKKTVRLGEPYIYKNAKGKWIINFPTKYHWGMNSNLKDIETGLIYLANQLKIWKVESLAVPPLGCTNGHLNWDDVFPLIKKHLFPLGIQLEIYAPSLVAQSTNKIHSESKSEAIRSYSNSSSNTSAPPNKDDKDTKPSKKRKISEYFGKADLSTASLAPNMFKKARTEGKEQLDVTSTNKQTSSNVEQKSF